MKSLKRHVCLIGVLGIVVALCALWATPVKAESDVANPSLKEMLEKRSKETVAAERPTAAVPEDPFGRGTPRSSVRGFLSSAKDRDYVRAGEYLDLRNLPPGMTEEQGPELARRLWIVLDTNLWIDIELLSTNPEGNQGENLPVIRERVGRLEADGKAYDLLLQRVPRGDGIYIWKFADVTVAGIPDLYQQFGYGKLERIFPAWMFDVTILGINLWLWAAVLALAVVLYPVAMLATKLIVMGLRTVHADLGDQFERHFSGPIALLIWTVMVRSAGTVLGSSIALSALRQARTVQIIGLAWLLMRVVDFMAERAGANLESKGLGGSRVLLTPVARLIKVVALAGAVLLWLDNVGYKVTTLLAGLSISGVAVALASQKSLENLFGAFTLFTSRPVKVGDFCRFGNEIGTVEEIGLRATRIRTLDRTVITVANAEFANLHLDNFSVRDRFWYHPTLQLRYETTPDQIRYILVEVRKMLYGHPKILAEPLHVRFKSFGQYSLDVEVFAYIGVTDYGESLEVAEDLNLRIMDIVSAAGSDFAFPSEVQYSLPGKPLDEDRAKAVGLQVKEWKAKQELYLPNFPAEKIAAIKNSLAYPVEGSPQYSQARG
ncbi:MAG TPA: mechanosensitive ion channel family protein [Nitrospira sp.]|nr:mechanosensitive ion channel family protein [Nitrospira sp.]